MIVLTLGYDRGWDVTLPAEGPLARRLGGPGVLGPALRGETPIPDLRMRAVHDFALEILRNAGRPSGSALRAFLGVGFTRSDVLEVIGTVRAHTGAPRPHPGETSILPSDAALPS